LGWIDALLDQTGRPGIQRASAQDQRQRSRPTRHATENFPTLKAQSPETLAVETLRVLSYIDLRHQSPPFSHHRIRVQSDARELGFTLSEPAYH
jgi:hypothetical protein